MSQNASLVERGVRGCPRSRDNSKDCVKTRNSSASSPPASRPARKSCLPSSPTPPSRWWPTSSHPAKLSPPESSQVRILMCQFPPNLMVLEFMQDFSTSLNLGGTSKKIRDYLGVFPNRGGGVSSIPKLL